MVIVSKTSLNWEISTDLMCDDHDDTWDFCPEPLNDESFLSWFIRLAKENCSDARLLDQQLKPFSSIKNMNLNRLGKELESIQTNRKKRTALIDTLAPFLTINKETLFSMAIPLEDNKGYLNIPLLTPRFCPYCLQEDIIPYFRSNWFVKPFTICSEHNCLLLDSCPHCNSPIRFWNTDWDKSIGTCSKCNRKLYDDTTNVLHVHNIGIQTTIFNVFKENIFNNMQIIASHFFSQLWKMILHEDLIIKELFNSSSRIPVEILFRAIVRCVRIFTKYPDRFESIIEKKKKDPILLTIINDTLHCESVPKGLNIDKIKEKYSIIHPLLDRVSLTAQDVRDRAKETKYNWRTLYYWMKLYRDKGIEGLNTHHGNSGRKRMAIPLDIEPYLDEYIHEYLFDKKDLTIKKIVQSCRDKAKNMALKDEGITYNTVRRRIIETKELT